MERISIRDIYYAVYDSNNTYLTTNNKESINIGFEDYYKYDMIKDWNNY